MGVEGTCLRAPGSAFSSSQKTAVTVTTLRAIISSSCRVLAGGVPALSEHLLLAAVHLYLSRLQSALFTAYLLVKVSEESLKHYQQMKAPPAVRRCASMTVW